MQFNNILKILSISAFMLLASCTCNKKLGDVYDATGQSMEENMEEVYAKMFDKIFFKFDSSGLSEDAIATLMEQTEWLVDNPDYDILIEGHCDIRGTVEYNLALGSSRANSVRAFFIENGVSPARIETVSYGKERPAFIGTSEEVHASNRRAVVVLKK